MTIGELLELSDEERAKAVKTIIDESLEDKPF